MLIHGRLLVTEHGFMLDELKSLLQKSLRRKDNDLVRKAAKELTSGKRDQVQWKGIVTFLFEDHCLNHVTVLEKLLGLYRAGNKRGCIEILSRCYTCRYSACHQVVAISDEYRQYEKFWDCKRPVNPIFTGLVAKQTSGMNIERLLTLTVEFWKMNDTTVLTSLFGLVNMAAKVEKRVLTAAGIEKLMGKGIKKPTLYQLVVSLLYRYAETDGYMKSLLMVCFRFMIIPDVPDGLILFSTLAQKMYKATILEKPKPDIELKADFWKDVGVLDAMPDWAVDKHTYRGKFGKSSAELFQRKYKNFSFSTSQLEEFHGERPKVGIPHFFDVGCICNKDILPENPIWEKTKEMYLKQKSTMQKSSKMTTLYYNQLHEKKSVIFLPKDESNGGVKLEANDVMSRGVLLSGKGKRKRDHDISIPEKMTGKSKKQKLLTDFRLDDKKIRPVATASTSRDVDPQLHQAERKPYGPLLQLPTGSGKVYTILDDKSQKVWKGPYRTKEKAMLCKFYHIAMKDIFGDKHTLAYEEEGQYIIFPLLKSKPGKLKVTNRAFYDCIAKKKVSEDEGRFVERDSLGLVQLHKLPAGRIRTVPVSVWAHFTFRYLLNVGDTGLYNAIATEDLVQIYGIDMEENRKQVKGNDIINMMFGKLPRSEVVQEIKQAVCERVEDLLKLIDKEFDYEKLSKLYVDHGLTDGTVVVKKRLRSFKDALEKHCQTELGV